MSKIIEKTLHAIPVILSQGLESVNYGAHLHMLVQNVMRLKAKYEEQNYIHKEIIYLKEQLSQPTLTVKAKREFLLCCLFCHILGYDVSFSYIHAVNLIQGTILDKTIGYIIAANFFSENHELVILLINSIQKDIKSNNMLESCIGLVAACNLVNTEMIPVILPAVEDRLTHSKPAVRKKAVICLHKYLVQAPNMVQHIHDKFKKVLTDKDIGVVWSGLHIFHYLLTDKAEKYKNLVPCLIHILNEILKRNVPTEYEYKHVPGPWMQIVLLKMLTLLGQDDLETSKVIYPVLTEVLKRCESNQNITFAIVYECILTIASLPPHEKLIEYSSKMVGKFLNSTTKNLRYLGIVALTELTKIEAKCALDHQLEVVECLEDEDPIIQVKTLDLLYVMTNERNVHAICNKMKIFIKDDKIDQSRKADVALNIIRLATRYSKDITWYINITCETLSMLQDLESSACVNMVLNKLQEGAISMEERNIIMMLYISILKEHVSNTVIQIGAWVIGEFYSKSHDTSAEIIDILYKHHARADVLDETRSWILSAVAKILPSSKTPVALLSSFNDYHNDNAIDATTVRQQLEQLKYLSEHTDLLQNMTVKCEKEQVMDFTLSFLDEFVSQSLEKGGKPYIPDCMRRVYGTSVDETRPFFAGVKPNQASSQSSHDFSKPSPGGSTDSASQSRDDEVECREESLSMAGVKRVWDREGYHQSMGEGQYKLQASNQVKPNGSTDDSTGVEITEVDRKLIVASSIFEGLRTTTE